MGAWEEGKKKGKKGGRQGGQDGDREGKMEAGRNDELNSTEKESEGNTGRQPAIGIHTHQTEGTSWGGTSKVTVRRSTTLTSSTQGSTKNKPAEQCSLDVTRCNMSRYCTVTWSFGLP